MKPKNTKLYEDLDVSPEASPDEIKKAYRKKANAHHPDKGGDPQKFHAVAHAYDILRDPKARRQYDRTGKAEKGNPEDRVKQVARETVAGMFRDIIDQAGEKIFHVDICDMIRDEVHNITKKLEDGMGKLKKEKGRLKRLSGRMKRAPDDNLFEAIVTRKILDNEIATEDLGTKRKVMKEILKILDHYEYQYEEEREAWPSQQGTHAAQWFKY